VHRFVGSKTGRDLAELGVIKDSHYPLAHRGHGGFHLDLLEVDVSQPLIRRQTFGAKEADAAVNLTQQLGAEPSGQRHGGRAQLSSGQDRVDAWQVQQLERGVLVAEWGEKLPPALRADALTLRFEMRSETARTITARAAGARGLALLNRWRALAPPGSA